MRTAIVLAGIALAALGGCGGDDEPDGGGEKPAALEGRLVYVRGGGFDGRTRRVRVEPDGRAVFATQRIGERPGRLTAQELEEVERAVARADLADLGSQSFTDPDPDPDTFIHQVSYRGETVSANGDAAPERLGALTATLSAIVDRHAPKRAP